MVARKIMITDFPLCHPDDRLTEVFRKMQARDMLTLPVVNGEGELVGVVSETNLLHAALPVFADLLGHLGFLPKSYHFHGYDQEQLQAVKVADVMTGTKLHMVDPETPVAEVAHLMLQHRLHAVPVVEEGEVIGMVTRHELVRNIVAPSLRSDR